MSAHRIVLPTRAPSRMMLRRVLLPIVAACLWTSPLYADSDPGVADPKKAVPAARSVTDPGYDVLLPDPEPASESGSKAGPASEQPGDLDIADRVLSAAKSVTTVAEAPAIITVVRADEIQARGYRTLTQLLETIPGWHTTTNGGTLFPFSLVRGTGQASLLLRDGVSMFDPALNLTQLGRVIPLETLKVVEVVNGPGGVLWGANSFLGIINLVSKDADDINGVEMGMGGGHGDGTREDFRAWVLFGKSFRPKRGPKISIVQHFSAETWLPPTLAGLLTVTRSAAPSPPGPQVWSDFSSSNPARAWLVNVSGKVSIGPVTLFYAAPFGEQNSSLSTGNNLAIGAFDTSTGMSVTTPQRNLVNGFERFLTAQYKDRFLRDRLGLDAKLYGVQFRREIDFVIVPGTRLNPPGLTLRTPVESYRVGFSVDGDAALPARNKLLFGGDVFHEWVPLAELRFRNAESGGLPFPDLNPGRLPINCPLASGSTIASPQFVPECPLPFIFGASRTVVALYVSDQFRPFSRLTIDAGVRYQAGLGQRGYRGALIGGNGQLLGSAAIVWNFWREMHLKANYAGGFRSPVFNNTDSNGAAVQFGGNRQLTNEDSQAFQGEWNARVLRNIGPIRALQLRVDYAYTQLKGLIVISQGSYSNRRQDGRDNSPNERHIHSVEAAAKLYAGESTWTLGYTFLHIDTNDRGLLRSIPQHTLSLGWVLPVIPSWLDLNGTLLLLSSYDDPNRFRSATVQQMDGSLVTVGNFSDVTFDKLPPQAQLNLGVRARFLRNRFWSSVNFYNVLNQRAYYPDAFYDVAPTLETTATPIPGWSFFLQVGGKPW